MSGGGGGVRCGSATGDADHVDALALLLLGLNEDQGLSSGGERRLVAVLFLVRVRVVELQLAVRPDGQDDHAGVPGGGGRVDGGRRCLRRGGDVVAALAR